MNTQLIDTIVQAVLYEGYILYPYRAATKKNRQRLSFGRVYPEPYSHTENGAQPCAMQTQCLIDGARDTKLEITVRFLQPMTRDIGEVAVLLHAMPALDNPDFFHVVPHLEVDGVMHTGWQEMVERTVTMPRLTVGDLLAGAKSVPFSFAAARSIEPIRDHRDEIEGVILRRQEKINGAVELSANAIDEKVTRVTVKIVNQTPVPSDALDDDSEIVMRTFASTHTILHTPHAQFISLIDPPLEYADAAGECTNLGTFPILVGDEVKHEQDAMISSPIILYDYPAIRPGSAGDLLDGVEFDEEKHAMHDVDSLTRRIVERTETLPNHDLLRLHGVMHGVEEKHHAGGLSRAGDPSRAENAMLESEDFFHPSTRLESVSVKGIALKQGDLVRVKPKARADFMDKALAGHIAVIESIEQDAENHTTHLALVLEDDPAREMGILDNSAHRYLYTTDEVEPLEGE